MNTIGKQEHQRLPFHQCLVSKQHFHVPWKTSVRTVYKPDYQYHITQVIFITMFKILLITIQAYDRYFTNVQMYRCIVFHYFQVVKTKYYMCAINIDPQNLLATSTDIYHTKSLHCFPQNVCIIFSTKVSGWSQSGFLLNNKNNMYIV